jgi:two-component system phosphate regulon sensor histidine kinase PhoR
MDAQKSPLALRPLALDEILMEVYEAHYQLAAQRHITLCLKQVDFIEITGEPGLLKRAFSNLVLNAIMYTEASGVIELSLEQEDDAAIFTVTDTGSGIPEGSLPYIFDRFYRVDQSRSSETGGVGLGLAIVKKIVETHKGHIDVSSKIGHGTTCRIVLNKTTL